MQVYDNINTSDYYTLNPRAFSEGISTDDSRQWCLLPTDHLLHVQAYPVGHLWTLISEVT